MEVILENEEVQGGGHSLEDLEDVKQDLFQDEFDRNSDYGSNDKLGTVLPRLVPPENMLFPDMFQTGSLLFYERFKTYQDYMLADCKPSEVREFTAEYLEKVLEPTGWQAVWRTDVFEVVVEVLDVDYSSLKAVVKLCLPFLCESRVSEFTQENISELLLVKEGRVPLLELYVVFDDSGEFDQTALAMEHLRFFYQNIWRPWDEEDEDDFDYFVRCAEPRLRLGGKVVHVVSKPMSISTLQCLTLDRLQPESENGEFEIEFHNDPLAAVNACYEGDLVIICPGHYVVHGLFSITDSIELEGYGLPDDIIIEKRGKGDYFVDCTGAHIKISNVKFVQHDAVEGIDFIDEVCEIPKITMENNVIHNNEGYAVVLVKPAALVTEQKSSTEGIQSDKDIIEHVDKIDVVQTDEPMAIVVPENEKCETSEEVEGNHAIANELVANSKSKRQIQKKRLSALGITKADDENLTSQEMFVSIIGNQFKRNGKGSFGTFLF
ncbi:SHC SH2 domain-binding protein 1 [Bombina bombina]|uniref:SHC SH2 domain-binding protein 1 n=1 Tax=Bombina bombina TaxID=8345 RepID=UPI00235A519E|nr:SHC SH2 domain-binding protein 1 [Bombina bombina]